MSTLASIRRTLWEVMMDLRGAVPGTARITLYAHPVTALVTLSAIASIAAGGMAAEPVIPLEGVNLVQWFAGLGPTGLLVALVFAILTGKLRTAQEIEAYAKRAERAEVQLDAMMPRIDRMLEATEALLLRERTRLP